MLVEAVQLDREGETKRAQEIRDFLIDQDVKRGPQRTNAEAFEKVLRTAGQIRRWLDNEELLRTLPTSAQSFVMTTKVWVEEFLGAMKDSGHPIEPILVSVLIHAVAVQESFRSPSLSELMC